MARNEALFTAVIKGNKTGVVAILNDALANGGNPEVLLAESMIPAMQHVGEKFSRNEVYVPEMLIAARAMQAGLDILEPRLLAAGHKAAAKVCIGTVKGDLHDIGKNLVAIMLKGAGFDVEDLGVDCSVEKFQASVNNGAQAVLCSAMLTTTMPYMKTVVDHFRNVPGVKVVIGGAPVTQKYAEEIQADGYGGNAPAAVQTIRRCLGLAA